MAICRHQHQFDTASHNTHADSDLCRQALAWSDVRRVKQVREAQHALRRCISCSVLTLRRTYGPVCVGLAAHLLNKQRDGHAFPSCSSMRTQQVRLQVCEQNVSAVQAQQAHFRLPHAHAHLQGQEDHSGPSEEGSPRSVHLVAAQKRQDAGVGWRSNAAPLLDEHQSAAVEQRTA